MQELLFYFTVYAFCGWLLENTYNKILGGPFLKPNFFYGPFKPMYGFAPCILILFQTLAVPRWLMLVLCLIIPTSVELLTGMFMLKIYHIRFWNYDGHRGQILKHGNLLFSCTWFGLALVILFWVQPQLRNLYHQVETQWHFMAPFMGIYFGLELWFANERHLPKVILTTTNNRF